MSLLTTFRGETAVDADWIAKTPAIDVAREVAALRKHLMIEPVFVIFDGPPDHVAGRFVEVENAGGKSINAGEWIERPDGYWALRLPR